LGLMAGLGLWWLTLISITTHFRERFQISSLKIINQIFGVLLFVLAILVLSRVI
jgi:threonine/homoserine/homoserine lactone efflux protein